MHLPTYLPASTLLTSGTLCHRRPSWSPTASYWSSCRQGSGTPSALSSPSIRNNLPIFTNHESVGDIDIFLLFFHFQTTKCLPQQTAWRVLLCMETFLCLEYFVCHDCWHHYLLTPLIESTLANSTCLPICSCSWYVFSWIFVLSSLATLHVSSVLYV